MMAYTRRAEALVHSGPKWASRMILLRPNALRYRSFSFSCSQNASKAKQKLRSTNARTSSYSPPHARVTRQSQGTAKPQDFSRFSRPGLILGGIMAFCIASYISFHYTSYKRATSADASTYVPDDVSARYNIIAPEFDAEVDRTERIMGLMKLRKKLVQKATGDVCEVSIGTGRNLSFYDWDFKGVNGVGTIGSNNLIKKGKVKSFTAVDKSAEMLEIAHEKFSKEFPGILGVRWVIQDASEPLPAPPASANERSGTKAGKKYDTIVQSMGLCSVNDPVGLLKNLGKSVNPDGGRILLLEHGQGTWGFVNDILDQRAPQHACKYGCWWNRDIGKIVEDSGLEVLEIKRKNFGTTWWIELKPRSETT